MARIQVEINGFNSPVSFSVKEKGGNDERFVSYDSKSGYIEFSSAGPGVRDYEVRIEFLFPGSGVVSFTVFQFDDSPSIPTPVDLPIPIPIPVPTPTIPVPIPVPLNYCKEGPYLFGSDPIRVMSSGGLRFQFHGVEVWGIHWEIKNESGVLRSGVVNPNSSICDITYDPLPRGAYELFIQGESCVSEVSSGVFFVEGSALPTPQPPVPVTPAPTPVPVVPVPIVPPTPIQPIGERILMIGYLHFITVANYIQMIDQYVARGFNAIYVNNLPMDQYFLTWTDFLNNQEYENDNNQFTGKAWDNWLLPILTHIRNAHPTVPVMFKNMANMGPWPHVQNEPENQGKDPWWPESHSVMDQFGLIANAQGSGIRRSPSFASIIARDRIAQWANWMNSRVLSILNPGQLRWMSYGTANTVELGFSQNATSFSNSGDWQSAKRFFHGDYSDAAILSYRQYLQDKYGSISGVNAAHDGPDWGSFNDITPPVSLSAPAPDPVNESDTALPWYEVYQGQRGQDWAQSRIRDIIRFVEALPIPLGVERVLEPGHIAYSFSHMTVGGAPKTLAQRLGKIKVASAASDILTQTDIHSDLFVSHMNQESWTELAVFDARLYATMFNTSITDVVDRYVRRQEQVGAGYYLQITSPHEIGSDEMFNYWTIERVQEFKSGPIISNPDTSSWPVINISFAEWSTIPDALRFRWLSAGGSNTNRIKINYQEPTIVGI